MKKRYFNISIKADLITLIKELELTIYSVHNNGDQDFILGYCNNKSKIYTLSDFTKIDSITKKNEYIFGYIPYDEKNNFLPVNSSDKEPLHGFTKSLFFKAHGTIIVKGNISLFFGDIEEFHRVNNILSSSENKVSSKSSKYATNRVPPLKGIERNEYIDAVKKIKKRIQNGDIYEMNYCINYESSNAELNTIETYKKLKKKTLAPFSALLKINESNVLSASPERFFNKSKNVLTSQPIKGTIKRGKNKKEDDQLILHLQSDEKEFSENVMIVDLVRNDMSKIALKSSVNVNELCKVYSFKTVHQLISTIQCRINHKVKLRKILESLFPMGSMTGAPKISAVNYIESYENFKREIYSGSIGFISPNNSFDFNVVIRTILYNSDKKTLSIAVGSAITIKSKPEAEYNECLLKLASIASVLS